MQAELGVAPRVVTETYSYTPGTSGAQMTGRTLTTSRAPNGGSQSVSFVYMYGQISNVNYGNIWVDQGGPIVQKFGPYFRYTFDTLLRPVKLSRYDYTTYPDAVETKLADAGAYGPAGELTSLCYASYLGGNYNYTWYTETRTYNVRGQLTRMQAIGDPPGYDNDGNYWYQPSPVDLEYRYSGTANDGRLTQMKNWVSGEEVNYAYDTLGRLTQAATTGTQWGINFGYDGFGNLTSESQVAGKNGGVSMSLAYDGLTNRINVGIPYGYDANGNLTSMPLRTMTYDIENRLVQVVHTSNGTEQHAYNPWGQRVWKSANGTEHVYLYGPDGRLLSTHWINQGYVMEPEVEARLGGKTLASGTGTMVEDRLGTAVHTGATSVGSYYPYGEPRNGGMQWATYRRDGGSGFDYAMNRYYSSQVGRFLTADPWPASNAPVLPQNWNGYSYVGGDPVNKTDPDGLCSPQDNPPCFSATGTAPMPFAAASELPGAGLLDLIAGRIFRTSRPLYMTSVDWEDVHPPAERPLVVKNLSKSGANWSQVEQTLQDLLDEIDADCRAFLESGGNDLIGYVADLLSNNLLAVGDFESRYAAFTGTAGTTLAPGDAAIVVNNTGAFFSSDRTVDQGKINGGTAKARAFTLLHELGHGLGASGFQDDYNNREAGKANDRLIDKNCKKTLSKVQ